MTMTAWGMHSCYRFASGTTGTTAAETLAAAAGATPTDIIPQKISFGKLLNPFDWDLGGLRETKEDVTIKKEIPEMFSQQPLEVQDYIRPERTLFESLEDWWDWIITFLSPVDKQVEWMRRIHQNGLFGVDMSWGMIFVLWGVTVRFISLIPMLYGQRNTLRMAAINPQINEIQQKIKALKSDRTISSADRRIEKEGYNRMKTALYTKHRCSQTKSFLSGIASPLLVTAFLAVRRMAMYEDDLDHVPFLWVSDMTMPDPTMMLPVICSGIFMMNFELNQGMNKGGRSSVGLYMRWGMRVVSIGMLYFFQSQPSAIFAYWIGLSGFGMMQPLLLRSTAFRKFFDFPPPPAVVQERQAKTKTPIAKLAEITNRLVGRKVFTEAAVEAADKSTTGTFTQGPDKKIVDRASGATFERLEDSGFEVVFEEDAKKSTTGKPAAARAP